MSWKLDYRDIQFLVETVGYAHVGHTDSRLPIDQQWVETALDNDRLFQRIMHDEEILVEISPWLFFTVLLRQARRDLKAETFTVERRSRQRILILDTDQVIELLEQPAVLDYLAALLASFTRVQSVTVRVPVRKGFWRRYRTSDLDVESLMHYSQILDPAARFAVYKRIGDVCLFLTGIFPEYVDDQHRYPLTGQVRPRMRGRILQRREDYEKHGQAFYRLAAHHEQARVEGVSDVLATLAENFIFAEKPLAFVANRYLGFNRYRLFGL